MSIEWVRKTMIVPAAKADGARALVEQHAPGQGEGMFRTGLSADGHGPATHYVSSGSILAEFGAMLDAPTGDLASFLADCVVVDADKETPHETFARIDLCMIVSTEL